MKYPIEAIWLRPKRVEIAKIDAEKIARSLSQSSLDLVRDVRIAYTNLSQAKERVQLAAEAVDLTDQVSELVGARYEAGSALELEVTTATSDGLQAKQELAKLEDDVKLATHRLAKLLGIGLSEIRIDSSGLATEPSIPADSAALMSDAFAARPDLRAAEIAIEAAMKRAGLAQAEVYKLTALYDTNGSGSNFEDGPESTFPSRSSTATRLGSPARKRVSRRRRATTSPCVIRLF